MDPTGLIPILLAGLVAYAALGVGYAMWILTHPPRRGFTTALARGWPPTPADLPPTLGGPRAFTEWIFTTRSLALPVWDIPGDDSAGPITIFTPGWGSSRVTSLARLALLARRSCRVVMWELPGHGDAPRRGLCRLGTTETADLACLVGAIARDDSRSIVLAGYSLGAGVSIAAAAECPGVAGVIAEAPYRLPQTPARNVIRAQGLPHWFNLPVGMFLLGMLFGQGPGFMRRRTDRGFDRAGLASRVAAPVIVIHGDADEVCPLSDGRDIAAAAPRGTFIAVPGGGHTDLWSDERLRRQASLAYDDAFTLIRASAAVRPTDPPSQPPPRMRE